MDPHPYQRLLRGQGSRRVKIAAVTALVLGAAGCGFEPVREVSPAEATVETPPEALAFVTEDDETAVSPALEPVPSPTVGNVPAASWILDTDRARVGAYSAPDTVYTRLGILEPDDLVLSTGRRVDNDGVVWMEIAWGDTTAWVIEVAFAVTPGADSSR